MYTLKTEPLKKAILKCCEKEITGEFYLPISSCLILFKNQSFHLFQLLAAFFSCHILLLDFCRELKIH